MSTTHEKTDRRNFAMGRVCDRPLWVLYFSIAVRAMHQVGAAVFLAAFLLERPGRPPGLYLYLAVLSGLVLYGAEGMRHRQLHRETAGVATFLKCLLIGVGLHGLLSPPATVLAGFVLASLAAHAPKHIRHRLLF